MNLAQDSLEKVLGPGFSCCLVPPGTVEMPGGDVTAQTAPQPSHTPAGTLTLDWPAAMLCDSPFKTVHNWIG